MRIEINAGGSAAISGFQNNMSAFVSSTESVISSFKAVKREIYTLSGGVGNLQDALDNVQARINAEEEKKAKAAAVQKKINDFWDLAVRVDNQVSNLVNQNKEKFFQANPWLRPVVVTKADPPPKKKKWYQKVWDWLCDAANTVAETAKKAWNGLKNTVKKVKDGIVDFYNKYEKIINTALIVVGAVLSVVAVIATGGVALVPLLSTLLTTFGCAMPVAVAISTAVSVTVAVVAVVSTVASSALNVVDIWCEIDNPVFNGFQSTFNIINTVSNLTYSVGNIYNSVKGVSGKEFIARQKAIENGKLGYSNLDIEHSGMKHKSGADFDQTRKKAIYNENMKRNGGQLRSDQTGKLLDTPAKSIKGVAPSKFEAQIDHIYPKNLGGANSFSNAQVIERSANIAKSANPNFSNYIGYSRPDLPSISGIVTFGTQGLFSASVPYINK